MRNLETRLKRSHAGLLTLVVILLALVFVFTLQVMAYQECRAEGFTRATCLVMTG